MLNGIKNAILNEWKREKLFKTDILGVFRIRSARYGIDGIPEMIVGSAKIDQTNNCERRVRIGGLISRHVVVPDGR